MLQKFQGILQTHINSLKLQLTRIILKIQSLLEIKHFTIAMISWLILFKGIIRAYTWERFKKHKYPVAER